MKGVSATQDARFSDKERKLLRTMKFPKIFEKKVDMKKVNITVFKPWIAKRVLELLGMEDEVVVEFVFGILEEEKVDPKKSLINLTGFLEKNAPIFMEELWALLLSAQESPTGIPMKFIEEKKVELLKKKKEEDKMLEKIKLEREKDASSRELARERRNQKDDGVGSSARDVDSRSPRYNRHRDNSNRESGRDRRSRSRSLSPYSARRRRTNQDDRSRQRDRSNDRSRYH